MCSFEGRNKSLVFQWENSPHAAAKEGQVGCYTCHASDEGDELGYMHEGAFIKAILVPSDCGRCHEPQTKQMSQSHHATAGEIHHLTTCWPKSAWRHAHQQRNMASGCWQNPSVVALKRDKNDWKLSCAAKPMRPDGLQYVAQYLRIGGINPHVLQRCLYCLPFQAFLQAHAATA